MEPWRSRRTAGEGQCSLRERVAGGSLQTGRGARALQSLPSIAWEPTRRRLALWGPSQLGIIGGENGTVAGALVSRPVPRKPRAGAVSWVSAEIRG